MRRKDERGREEGGRDSDSNFKDCCTKSILIRWRDHKISARMEMVNKYYHTYGLYGWQVT
jgi:hypothetical protein